MTIAPAPVLAGCPLLAGSGIMDAAGNPGMSPVSGAQPAPPRGDLTLCAANLSFLFRHQFKTEAAARNKQQSHKGKKLMAS